MITMFAKHPVKDFSNWKATYDNFGATRQAMGVTGASVYQDPNDSNMVTISHQFNTMDAAQAFAGSEELKEAMMKAGVAGTPEIWFAKDVEHTAF